MGQLSAKSPADLLADYVEANNIIGGASGWPYFVGNQPDAPDQCVTFIDTSGPPGFPSISIDQVGVQVLVRGNKGAASYKDAYCQIQLIRTLCLGMQNAPAEFLELWGVSERSQPVPLGNDDKDRPNWSHTYLIWVGPDPTPNRQSA